MTKSLIVNCYLKPLKIGPLLKAIEKFSECTVINFRDLYSGYKVEKDIDAGPKRYSIRSKTKL